MRPRKLSGGWNMVSLIASGAKIFWRAKSGSVWPLTRRTISPSRMKLISLYTKRAPGAEVGFSRRAIWIPVWYPLHAGKRSRSGRKPEKCVIRLRTVISLLPPWNSGRYSVTRSLSRTLPSSNSFISEDVVAIALVSEAQSKMVSAVIGSSRGIIARRP